MSEERTVWYFAVSWYEDQPNGTNPDNPPITRMVGIQHTFDSIAEAKDAHTTMLHTRSWFPTGGYDLEITDIATKKIRSTDRTRENAA